MFEIKYRNIHLLMRCKFFQIEALIWSWGKWDRVAGCPIQSSEHVPEWQFIGLQKYSNTIFYQETFQVGCLPFNVTRL